MTTLDDPPEMQIRVEDKREPADVDEVFYTSKELEKEKVVENLCKIKNFLGSYSSQTATSKDISVNLKNGKLGSGECVEDESGIEVTVYTPGLKAGIDEILSKSLSEMNISVSKKQARDIFCAVQASTALHESTHVLLDSKPHSKFARYIESHGFENKENADAGLLDEGITYALMAEFAPVVEPIGSISPKINSWDSKLEVARKTLGKSLEGVIHECIGSGWSMNEEFMEKALVALRNVQTNNSLNL
ncbi:MAG: hypothetical protein ABIJ82_03065 [Patescibacteria group bacterium]|nr:hypothetical protein [Patescibacteria group bacterium]MBU1953147.1 hypothetical protein [Patescibacteria group bacterium]